MRFVLLIILYHECSERMRLRTLDDVHNSGDDNDEDDADNDLNNGNSVAREEGVRYSIRDDGGEIITNG